MSDHKFHNLLKSQFAFLAPSLAVRSPAAENSPFYLPIPNIDLPALTKLVHDSGPNARDAQGHSPLMCAAAVGSLEGMRLLVDAGADPNAGSDFGAAMQRKEEDWPNYGPARPPLEDGGFSHTAKGIRAPTLYAIPGRKAEFGYPDRPRRRRARTCWAAHHGRRTMQILGIAWAGRKAPANRVEQLVAKQRVDRGWGQMGNPPADAYATGEAFARSTNRACRHPTPFIAGGCRLPPPHATRAWHPASSDSRLGFPAVFPERLSLPSRPVDLAGGHGPGNESADLPCKLRISYGFKR